MSQRCAADLSAEFHAQAEREAAAGLPVTVALARTPAAKARMELSFLRFVVAPLYIQLAELAPQLAETLLLLDANSALPERGLSNSSSLLFSRLTHALAVGEWEKVAPRASTDAWRRELRAGQSVGGGSAFAAQDAAP